MYVPGASNLYTSVGNLWLILFIFSASAVPLVGPSGNIHYLLQRAYRLECMLVLGLFGFYVKLMQIPTWCPSDRLDSRRGLVRSPVYVQHSACLLYFLSQLICYVILDVLFGRSFAPRTHQSSLWHNVHLFSNHDVARINCLHSRPCSPK